MMTQRRHSNVQVVGAKRDNLMPIKSRGGAKSAKEPEEGRGSRAQLVLASTMEEGYKICSLLTTGTRKVTIYTQPDHLKDILLFPNETVHVAMGINPNFLEALRTSASMFSPGESFTLKLYSL